MRKSKRISDTVLIQNILNDINNFNPYKLDKTLNTFQLWSWNGGMLTAQMTRESVIDGLNEKRFFIISGQAVGQLPSLNLN